MEDHGDQFGLVLCREEIDLREDERSGDMSGYLGLRHLAGGRIEP